MRYRRLVGALVVLGALTGCAELGIVVGDPTPSPSASAEATPTPTASSTASATPTLTPAPDATTNAASVGEMPRGFSVPLDVAAAETLDGLALCRGSADYPSLRHRVASRFWTATGDPASPGATSPASSPTSSPTSRATPGGPTGGTSAGARPTASPSGVRSPATGAPSATSGEGADPTPVPMTSAGGALLVTTDAAARDLMAEIRARAASCEGTQMVVEGVSESWAPLSLDGQWEQAIVLGRERRADATGDAGLTGGEVVIIAQRRHAISFSARGAADATPVRDPAGAQTLAEQTRVEAERVLAQLVGR